MINTIISIVKEIIGLKAQARQDKKIGLEIEELENKKNERETIVSPATFDEIKEFDPFYQRINEKELARERPPRAMVGNDPIFAIIAIVSLIIIFVLCEILN